MNPHMRLIPLLGKIFKFNISYILILPLFDQFNIKILSSQNNLLSLALIQYLKIFGVNNTYLYYKDYENYLWFKAKEPTDLIDRITIDELNPNDIEKVLSTRFDIIKEVYPNHVLFGIKIPDKFYNDLNLIKKNNFYSLSNLYYNEILFRNTIYYYDDSIQSTLVHHQFTKNVIRNSPKLKEVFEEYFKLDLKGKQLLGRFNKEDETLSHKEVTEFN